MDKILKRGFVGLLIAMILLIVFMPNITHAGNGLILEKSHEWVNPPGNACMAYAVATGDIDADGVIEIVTVGYFNHSTKAIYGTEIDVWNWNGSSLNLEHAELTDASGFPFGSDDTRFTSVAIGNVDLDNEIEIVSAGYMRIGGKVDQGLVCVSNWNGTHFTFKTFAIWPGLLGGNHSRFYGVALGDIDRDGATEIVTVGYHNTTSFQSWPDYVYHGAITIWNVTGTTIMLEKSKELVVGYIGANPTYFDAVALNDIDNDGDVEIIIGGNVHYHDLDETWALLRIYNYNATDLYFEKNYQWSDCGDTRIKALATSDVDLDEVIEIVTVGDSWDGDGQDGQLRVWSWDGDSLILETSREWDTGYVWNRIYSLGIGDLDRDNVPELITSGFTSGINTEIRVWSWYQDVVNLEETVLWNATAVYGITANDIDNDGTEELITVGYRSVASKYNATLGIWSVSKVGSSITVEINPSITIIGNQITIRGYVVEETGDKGVPNAEVTIMSSREPLPVFTTIGKVRTNENGEYTLSWIPPAPGEYAIMVSWNGDYEHEGATATTTLTVEKASSMITLTLSSYTITIGEEISISGTLYPAKTATISIEYTNPEGIIPITKTVNSNEAGFFSTTFTANQTGIWTIKAKWSGDETYKAAESAPATLTVTKIPSALTITASALTVNVNENVTITGTLTPAQMATVTLTYIAPNGTTLTHTVASNDVGTFTDIIKLDRAGVWQVKASWNGNEECEAAESSPITLTAQTADPFTQTLAITGFGLGLIALILALAGVYMALKKKPSAPPSAPTPTSPTQ